MTNYFLLAAATLATVTSPALARDAKPSDNAPVEATQRSDAPRAAAPERRYCVVDTATGSRIPHKTCRTRAEWLADDFDPLAK